MAFSLLALLDDVASMMDDVSVMSKIAFKKTSAVMSDDLAVNANQVHGVLASRELPVIWAIFKSSLLNKVICILLIMFFNFLYPPINSILLSFGALYLSYEGFHKVLEYFHHKKKEDAKDISEEQKIKGAIRTDLVLSLEIILIAKNYISGDFIQILLSLTLVGIAASVFIYGLVAILVKLDDFGFFIAAKGYRKTGQVFLRSMPIIMKLLSLFGTIAMFLVAGGIFSHLLHLHFIKIGFIQDFIIGLVSGIFTYIASKVLIRLSHFCRDLI